ncbi:GNAT family N-acetyltransferase [Alkaliphilus transvaalensis]|uniref:GNAT family N-acetyltransferase n=1 Tax=Alkaliphilus transvaalensis TaxID=114628 RepID=UPI0004791D0B|nr:GNAT family N-acetyltransferase [Alkaliphilus transvaalensis]
MFQLENINIDIIRPLLNKENSHYPLLKSIISKKKKGKVYVDCLNKPSVAAILSDNGWFYLVGETSDDNFNSQLMNFLVSEAIVANGSILWFGIPEEWKKKIVGNTSVVVRDYPRVQYKFIGYDFDYDLYSKKNFKYKLKEINSDNIDEVFEYNKELSIFWESKELFLKNGFGYILLDGNQIIGHAISASVEAVEAEIDIQTQKEYRGKGIAAYLTSHLIKVCLKHSIEPKWDCSVENTASNKLASKLGFQMIKEYPFSIITTTQKI